MYGPDPANTGSVESAGPKRGIEETWQFSGEEVIATSPTLKDETVYVGEVGEFRDDQSHVYAVDATDGSEKWRYESAENGAPSLAVTDEYTIVAESRESYDNDDSGCITALDRSTGAIHWQFEVDDVVYAAPTVVDGTVFVGSHDNNLYAIDCETGEETWRFRTNSDVATTPAVSQGTVFIGSGRKDGHVYAVDAETGREQWRFKTGEYDDFNSMDEGGVFNAIAVSDGVVYAGAHDERLYALDAESGDERWNFKAEGGIDSSPALDDGTLFFSTWEDNIYAVDAIDGSVRWKVDVPTSQGARPVVADETLYIGAGILRAFDPETGEELWNDKSFRGEARPAIVDGTMYIGSGHLTAFEDP
jgi:outer membrane protein assembly factor BamB